MAIKSPCTLVCTMDPATGLCLGCARTLQEIAGWSGFSSATRLEITADLGRRQAALSKRRQDQRADRLQRSRTAVSSNAQ